MQNKLEGATAARLAGRRDLFAGWCRALSDIGRVYTRSAAGCKVRDVVFAATRLSPDRQVQLTQ